MTREDLERWADLLQTKYGIAWPIDTITTEEENDD